jgi:hypothetical protein
MKKTSAQISPKKAAALVAGVLPLTFAYNAGAFTFENGDVNGSLDTTVSFGQLWRVESRDKSNDDINANDGNRNFNTGLVSQVFKVTSDLQANYKNYGVFLRGTAFYDTQIMDHGNDYYDNNVPDQPSQNYPRDNRFTKGTRDKAGSDAEILDAYVFGNWDVLDHPVSGRLGRQVFSWGEGLFYRSGINSSNPVDAGKFHLPGAEVKEALIPLEAVSLNFGITNNLSMETYYQWNWRETAIDPVGTYFSPTDLFADGGNTAYAQVNDPLLSQVIAAYPLASQFGLVGNGPFGPNAYTNATNNTFAVAHVGKDINAKDNGQFGVAFRYTAEELNNTEFGLYFMNYHAQEPQVAVDFGNYQGVDFTNPLWGVVPSEARNALAGIDLAGNAVARAEYPENIRMLGLSFSTVVANASVFGEVAYRPNAPIGLADPGVLVGDILAQSILGLSKIADGSTPNDQACAVVAGRQLCRSGALHNYERVELFDTSLGTIYDFGPSLSFDSFTGIAEIASEHVRGSSLTYTAFDGSTRGFAGAGAGTTADRDAYGFTTVVSGTWNNVYSGISLSPSFVYKYDFKGVSPAAGRFNEGAKGYTFGMRANYLDSLQAEVSYTIFTGAGHANGYRDRDNVGLNVKYSF